MLRCKKGDLAICLRAPVSGRMVEVGEFIGKGLSQRGVIYENCWAVTWRDVGSVGKTGRRFAESDSDLFPIRPGDLKETEETEKEVENV